MIVSERLREGCQASLIEEACHERGQVGGQVSMGTRESRGTGSRELGWLTPLLHKAKEVLKVGYTCQHASRCKSLFLKNDSDHRRMHVIEQVLSKVRGSQQVGSTRDLSSCLVNGLNDSDIAGVV